ERIEVGRRRQRNLERIEGSAGRAALDGGGQHAADAGCRGIRGLVVALDDRDLGTREQEGVRDAGAHPPAAEDADPAGVLRRAGAFRLASLAQRAWSGVALVERG